MEDNETVDPDDLLRTFQNLAHPVENRKEKEDSFSAFLTDVLNEFTCCPALTATGTYSHEMVRFNITEKYTELGKSDEYVTRIDTENKVYHSALNGEKFFIFNDSFYSSFDGFLVSITSYDMEYFEKVLAENLEDAFIKVCSRWTQNSREIVKQKVAAFVGKSSEYLKEDSDELGWYACFLLKEDSGAFTDRLCIWISDNFIKEMDLFQQ